MDEVLITVGLLMSIVFVGILLASESASSGQGYVKPAAPETEEHIRGY